jgi:hypothetical protein
MSEFMRRARFGMLVMRCSEFVAKWPGSEFGPAHLVLEDSNFDDRCILYCVRTAFKELARKPNDPELVATLVFLLKLSEEPEGNREEPEGDEEPVDASISSETYL